jgi:pimeloyl-ACP methyl ester carboxylesterase
METFVLLHGTGAGGWLWDPVAGLLREHGHLVHAPTLIGVEERASEGGPDTNLTTHVQQIVSLIEEQVAPKVVLVGFSYSGVIAEGVAAAIPDRIATLVLIDAMTVAKGKSGFDALTPSAAERVRAAVASSGEGWMVPPNPLESVGGIGAVEADISVANIERTLKRRGTHPIGTYEEPVTWDESSIADVARCYIMCTDKVPGAARDWSLARISELRDAGYTVHELRTAHFPMQTMPRALTSLLLVSTRPAAST